jgi:hypothetical protein
MVEQIKPYAFELANELAEKLLGAHPEARISLLDALKLKPGTAVRFVNSDNSDLSWMEGQNAPLRIGDTYRIAKVYIQRGEEYKHPDPKFANVETGRRRISGVNFSIEGHERLGAISYTYFELADSQRQ